ncbi:MAG: DNA repair protein RecO [Candidatus Latescibacteria bacterium]|nr:DNA repair protein RecO [Candidatus Latescibacterota bacterium]
MPLCTTEAIILNRYVLGDTSLLVALYTKDYGKLKVVAKGARSAKSKIAGGLEPFTHIQVSFRRREQRELQTLSQVEVVTSFRHLGEDLTKMAYAGAVTEMINRLVIGEEPSPSLFGLLLEALMELNRHPADAGEVLFWGFELRFAVLFGYAPQFVSCPVCHRPLDDGEARFSPALGGVLCPRCFGQDSGALPIAMGTVKVLERIQAMPLSLLSRLKPSRLSQREIAQVLRAFLVYHTEDARELKSLKFLRAVQHEVSGE